MQIVKRLFITGLIITLASCGSTPIKKDDAEVVLTLESLSDYLRNDGSLSSEELNQRKLKVAEFLVTKKESDRAAALIQTVIVPNDDDAFFLRYMLAKGRIAILQGEPYLAQRYLFHRGIDEAKLNAHPDIARQLLDLSATLQYDLAEYLRAFELRLQLNTLLIDDDLDRQLNHDLIWEALSELSVEQLQALAEEPKRDLSSDIKRGWFSLAALSKSNGANYRQQIRDIHQWQRVWPEHPANSLLPADLQLILQLSHQQAIEIAVMLPLTGKLGSAGRAIQDGLLAGYYDDAETTEALPTLRFYDTVNQDVAQLYHLATAEGAQLVIGPLLKENVLALAQQETLGVPVLALNTLDSAQPGAVSEGLVETDEVQLEEVALEAETQAIKEPVILNHSTLFQFTLAVESEAVQVAEKAWRDGHRRVMIVAPASSWGDRSVLAFRGRWEALGGLVIEDRRFKDQRSYSPLIKSTVAIDQSEQRKSQIQRILGKNLEFEPRSRKDIDFIFMPSYATQAKQLKPLLAFHYAGDIPVYAMSQVYNGQSGQNLSDLNGIKFSALPWFFDSEAKERSAIELYGENSRSLQHFYAMGVDAYHIYPRLEQLKRMQQAQFYGQTGKLKVTQGNVISREQTWAEVRNGMAVEIKNSLQFNQAEQQ